MPFNNFPRLSKHPTPHSLALCCHSQFSTQVEWHNPADPTKGFKYLYLSPADHAAITDAAAAASGAAALRATRVLTEAGEERYMLTGAWGFGDHGASLAF